MTPSYLSSSRCSRHRRSWCFKHPPQRPGLPPVLASRASCGAGAAERSARRAGLPSMVPPPVPRRGSQAGRPPATAGSTFATSSPWRWLASGVRTRCSFATGSQKVIIPVRTPRLDIRNPFLVCVLPLTARSDAHLPTHPRTADSAPWRPISTAGRCRVRRILQQGHRPGRSTLCLAAPAFELAAQPAILASTRHLVDPSHVARRRFARAHSRPCSRSRRWGSAKDLPQHGTAASRRARRSSGSSVPVPAAHGAIGAWLRDTPPT